MIINYCQGWEFDRSFLRKNECMSDLLKITSDSLILSERPERFAHGRSILVSDLSDSFTSLIFGERPERFPYIAH